MVVETLGGESLKVRPRRGARGPSWPVPRAHEKRAHLCLCVLSASNIHVIYVHCSCTCVRYASSSRVDTKERPLSCRRTNADETRTSKLFNPGRRITWKPSPLQVKNKKTRHNQRNPGSQVGVIFSDIFSDFPQNASFVEILYATCQNNQDTHAHTLRVPLSTAARRQLDAVSKKL